MAIDVTADAGGGLRARSDVLGLDLCWQPPKLRLWDPTEKAWLPDPDDQAAARKAAEDRASAAEDRASAAEDRASAAEAQLAELRARLRGTFDKPSE